MRRSAIGGFEAWTDQVYAEEERNAQKLDAKLRLEEHWLLRGVTARRKRNQGRLSKLDRDALANASRDDRPAGDGGAGDGKRRSRDRRR